jgi:hypothetical protein
MLGYLTKYLLRLAALRADRRIDVYQRSDKCPIWTL